MEKKTLNDWLEEAKNTPEVWEKDWEISPEGDIKHKENGYEIGHDELGAEQDMGQNWLGHMAGKRWVDLNTFVPAYIEACRRAKIETVYIDYGHCYPED